MSERYELNKNLAQMLKGGVIMDVVNAKEAEIAQKAGAVAVMALERVPSDIRKHGGVARMSDPKMIKEIQAAVSIPVMAKVRIGHFVEAQILQGLNTDYIDESEVLTPADEVYHIDKKNFKVPFVCGARNLGEALRRIGEGASMIRTKGEAGTGNVVEAVRHMRTMMSEIRKVQSTPKEELMTIAKEMGAPYELILYVAEHGKLPVVNFAAGGIATPDPSIFPIESFKAALNEVLDRDKGFAFGYQESNGYEPLRETLCNFLFNHNKIKADANQIQIVSGAQQGIDIIGKALLNPGDFVITENPTYTGAVAVFKSRGKIRRL